MQDTLLYKARLIMLEKSSCDAEEEVATVLAKLGLTGAQDTQVCQRGVGDMVWKFCPNEQCRMNNAVGRFNALFSSRLVQVRHHGVPGTIPVRPV